MASDFHTHNRNPDTRALVSSISPLPGKLTSLEIHPWFLPGNYDPRILPPSSCFIEAAAIGEIGLDKLRGPEFFIQQRYLQQILAMASDCHKPVVIHCVKAFDELFAILKPFTLKVMIHGFRSSPQMLDELWKRKFTVSFHPLMVNNIALMKKLQNHYGAFGFESDDLKDVDIIDLLNTAEKNSCNSGLEKITDQFFADFLEE